MKILYLKNLDVGFEEGTLIDEDEQLISINNKIIPADGLLLIDTPEIREFLRTTKNVRNLINQIRTTPKTIKKWYANS